MKLKVNQFEALEKKLDQMNEKGPKSVGGECLSAAQHSGMKVRKLHMLA